jgi:hypothetical protein
VAGKSGPVAGKSGPVKATGAVGGRLSGMISGEIAIRNIPATAETGSASQGGAAAPVRSPGSATWPGLPNPSEAAKSEDSAVPRAVTDSGLRMIGSLGRDRAEASGELVPSGEPASALSETQRELVTILPRRITRELQIVALPEASGTGVAEEMAAAPPPPPSLPPPSLPPPPPPRVRPPTVPPPVPVAPPPRVRPPTGPRTRPPTAPPVVRAGTEPPVVVVTPKSRAGTEPPVVVVTPKSRAGTEPPVVRAGTEPPVAEEMEPVRAVPQMLVVLPRSRAGTAPHSLPEEAEPLDEESTADEVEAPQEEGRFPRTGSGVVRAPQGMGMGTVVLVALAALLAGTAVYLRMRRVAPVTAPVTAPVVVTVIDAAILDAPVRDAAGRDGPRGDANVKITALHDGGAPVDAGDPGDAGVKEDAAPADDKSAQAKALLEKANDAISEGAFERALRAADASLALRKTPRAHLARARALQRLDRVDEALAAINAAEQLGPKFASVFELRGRILWAIRRKDEARHQFSLFLQLEPDGARAAQVRKLLAE